MLNFTKNNVELVYVTANENATYTTTFYLFSFVNKITLEVVEFIEVNISTIKRFDKFEIDVNSNFNNSTLGFWGYEIYETTSNTDFTKTGKIVEIGFMTLSPASVTLPTEYTQQSNEFKVYNGE